MERAQFQAVVSDLTQPGMTTVDIQPMTALPAAQAQPPANPGYGSGNGFSLNAVPLQTAMGASNANAQAVSPKVAAALVTSLNSLEPTLGSQPQMQSGFGRAYAAAGDDRDAYSHFERAFNSGQRDVPTLTGYALTASHLGINDVARKASALALSQDPQNPVAASVFKLSSGKASSLELPSALKPAPEEGRSLLPKFDLSDSEGPGARSAGAGGPPDVSRMAQALLYRAATSIAMKEYDSAFQYSQRALELNPSSAPGYELRAQASIGLGNYPQAVADTEKALSLAPGNLPALLNRTWALIKLERYRAAVEAAADVIDFRPDIFHGYWLKAFAFAGLRDLRGMRRSLRKASKINPGLRGLYERALQLPELDDPLTLFLQAPTRLDPPSPIPSRPDPGLLLIRLLFALSGAAWAAYRLGMSRLAPQGAGMSSMALSFLGKGPGLGALGRAFGSQYRLVRELGKGGMGVVYEAVDQNLHRRVAVKCLRDEFRLDPRERGRFLSEAKLVAQLHHPGIVEIYSVGGEQGDVYLVFEYLSGKTVSQVLGEKGPLEWARALRLMRGACEAVQYAHAHGIVHRDIKPSNIMVLEGDAVKVMDFGIARLSRETPFKRETLVSAGTPAYMAPEQSSGSAGREADVYSLAICFYELLCGETPFPGQGAGLLLNKLNGKHVPISQRIKSASSSLDRILGKALSPRSKERYRGPMEFLAALESLGAACPV